MILLNYLRAALGRRRALAGVLCCTVLTAAGVAQPQEAAGQAAQGQTSEAAIAGVAGPPAEPTAGKRQAREAEDAYLAGAKKMEHDDLSAAQADFERAAKLDPENRNYGLAVSVTREHRVTELVQRAIKARQSGDQKSADVLLDEARAIDPDNPVVTEHSGLFVTHLPVGPQAVALALGRGSGAPGQGDPGRGAALTLLADRTQALAGPQAGEPWRIQGPTLAGAIRITPEDTLKDFDLRGTSGNVIRNVATAYGINAVIDDTVEQKNLHFKLEHVSYQVAMNTVLSMSGAFAAPVDAATVMVAKDDPADRQRLERQLEETIYLPGMATDQIQELAQVVKSVFEVKQTSVQTGLGAIVVRAPKDVLDPLNLTLKDLIDASGEVMIEVKLYEVDKTGMVNGGATIPTQFNVFSVDEAATSIVNANQALVQQAVAQGLVPAGTSNLEIALALIKAGLVQSSLASNLLGVFGGGLFQTGISGSSGVTVNLGLNTTDTRQLDDVQLRVGDRQDATFREGEKYPITTSTYSTGLSTASSAASTATINGVSVASLLSQYAGGTSATIPQISYEDLGVTLKAKPVIEKSGRISMALDLKIEALSGTSLDGNPVLESRQFTSGLTVADGESAMMVSNMSRTETTSMTGIPGLSELPGFQIPLQDSLERDDSQLVVVVTPHIVRRRADLMAGPRIPVRGLAEN
jgi:type II secretory pathway component GspD/PulD (secretin)